MVVRQRDNQTEPEVSASGGILLLGDDGRMARLLARRLGDWAVEARENVFDGLVCLAEMTPQLVLVHAATSGLNSRAIIRALREAAPEAQVAFYGDAYAEAYTRRCGADDYLTWPIPPAELRAHLGQDGREPEVGWDAKWPGRRGSTQDQTSVSGASERAMAQLIEAYQELALQIPQGAATLIDRAEHLLAEVLQVAWVRVHLERARQVGWDAGGASRSLTLYGPRGRAGEMLLGPVQGDLTGREGLVTQAAGLMGSLIHLAQRDSSLRQLATLDELTGAYNRRYLQHFVEQLIDQSREDPIKLTLLLFDIDEFKHYNDTYGHAAGDEILREMCLLMRRCCRAHDVVARLGGDEFVVLFWDTARRSKERTGAERRCLEEQQRWTHDDMVGFMSNRFRRLVKTKEFPMLGHESRGALSISGGLATHPEGGRTLEALLASADTALLKAKGEGKDRIRFGSKSPQQDEAP